MFHLTARTQGRQPWFTPRVRDHIVRYVARAFCVSDAWLLAFAVMPDHLHLVVRQAEGSLGDLMQPLLRRIALLVQRTHGVEGHVFERRYADTPCLTPEHARNAIVYVHLNPVRAGLVTQPDRYGWTSHTSYLGLPSPWPRLPAVLARDEALGLFAARPGAGTAELVRSYRRVVAWRIGCDRCQRGAASEDEAEHPPTAPLLMAAAPDWMGPRGRLLHSSSGGSSGVGGASQSGGLDLRDIALQTLAEHAPSLPLERVRSSDRGAAVVRVRRLMVVRMAGAGYAGRAIARYLRVSEQCVSNIRRTHLRARGC